MSRCWDYVVVGAGIVGLTIAQYLRRRDPTGSILVLQRGRAGDGASRYSVGLHFPYGRTEERRRLSELSHREHSERFANTTYPYFTAVPFVGVVKRDNAGARISEFHAPVREETDPKIALGSLAPSLRTGDHTLLSVEECHYADVGRLCGLLADGLRRNDRAEIWEGAPIAEIAPGPADVVLQLSYGETVRAAQVILAIGPWVRERPFDHLLRELDIRVKKVVALHVNRLPKKRDAAIFFLDEDAFLLPMYEAGYWVLSYTSTKWGVSPAATLEVTREDRQEALGVLDQYLPELTAACHGGRAFCDAYTSEPAPVVRRLVQYPRVILAGAAGGSGYRLSPGIAIQAAELAARGT